MEAKGITKEDLNECLERVAGRIMILIGNKSTYEPKRFLRSYQVRDLLKISNNDLRTMRDNGTIPFIKIGGILYYNYGHIINILKNKLK